jgi:hypothetical protein
MALDIEKTFQQIQAAAQSTSAGREDAFQRLAALLEAALRPDIAASIEAKARASRGVYNYLPASPREDVGVRHTAPALPPDFAVAATDGSHIASDRHLPMRCYLINTGGCLLTYGSHSDARFFSEPRLYARDEDLDLTDPGAPMSEVPVDGVILGVKRAVMEMEALADLAKQVPGDIPLLALVDGTLILWGLAGERTPPFVPRMLIDEGLVPAMESLREQARARSLALVSYISLPGSPEVVNALRLVFCPYSVADCRQHCGGIRSGQRPCDTVHGFADRALFQALLEPGERSALFATRSSIVRDHYGPHQVCFCYVNMGEEIARIEMPEWAATDGALLGMAHALVLDQCRRGQGYPVALSESHEQAVVTSGDREQFRTMVEEALQDEHLPVYTSEKDRSKRLRWL